MSLWVSILPGDVVPTLSPLLMLISAAPQGETLLYIRVSTHKHGEQHHAHEQGRPQHVGTRLLLMKVLVGMGTLSSGKCGMVKVPLPEPLRESHPLQLLELPTEHLLKKSLRAS